VSEEWASFSEFWPEMANGDGVAVLLTVSLTVAFPPRENPHKHGRLSWLQRQGSNLRKSSKTKEKSKGDAQRDTQRLVPLGRDLSLVVTAWSKLPAPLKTAILAIVQSVNSSEEAAP
jgi:hypothetical protein